MGDHFVGSCINLAIPKSQRQVRNGMLPGNEIRNILYKDLSDGKCNLGLEFGGSE